MQGVSSLGKVGSIEEKSSLALPGKSSIVNRAYDLQLLWNGEYT